MPVTQTMVFAATPPTTGETPTVFNYNAIACWNDLKLNIIPDLNTAFTQMNALETNVNAKELSTVSASTAAVAAANFQGTWTDELTSIGQSWEYSGVIYGVLIAGTDSPTTTPSNWFALTIAQSIKNTPAGAITATTVQGATNELDSRVSSNTTTISTINATISTHIPLSGITSYHLLSGSLALSNSVTDTGFATTLYTGNGTTQSINTGVDMATQWGNSAGETFGGLVWIKGRSGATNHFIYDTVCGVTKEINSNTTDAEAPLAQGLTSFNVDGFTIGSDAGHNTNLTTYASWNFQTTHRTSGTTNHGKAYTEHYNPFTGFTIIKYEGSGLAGHEIPHSLGRKLGFTVIKTLTSVNDWLAAYRENFGLNLNLTNAEATGTTIITSFNDVNTTVSTGSVVNTNGIQYIMYGWANSYFDEANTLVGNYEIGVYQGTGAAGNKVTTRDKPAWVMFKRVDSTGDWNIFDNQRVSGAADGQLYANSSIAESIVSDYISYQTDGFTLAGTGAGQNALGGQYLYMVVYDNASGSGKSKYSRATDTSNLNLNAIIPYANGIDANGTKSTILTKNETVSGLTLTQGKNYVYAKNDGTYGVSAVAPSYGKDNPALGDFYNVLENKWYTSGDVAITESRNYLDSIVYADADGQPTYVEQLPKTEYKNDIEVDTLKVLSGFDLNQDWVNVTASRFIGVTYYNTSGKPKKIHIEAFSNSVSQIILTINGTHQLKSASIGASTSNFAVCELEPNDSVKLTMSLGTGTLTKWFEK